MRRSGRGKSTVQGSDEGGGERELTNGQKTESGLEGPRELLTSHRLRHREMSHRPCRITRKEGEI